jgi:segregation and condensation protein B
MSLKAKLEAVIYAAEEPVTLAQLAMIFADEALAWQAEQEAARAEAAAVPENESFEYVETGAEAIAEAESIEAGTEPEAEPVAVAEEAQPTQDAQPAEEAAEEPEEAGDESQAEPDPVAEARRAARQRDKEVRTILRGLLDEIIASYAADGRGVEIREIAGGFRMATKPECHDAVRSFIKSLKPAMKLSLPALETLAVIAYKQPVTAPEVNEIRGVDSSGVFGSLLARKLIATAGRKPVIGRPILYKTTKEFLLRFGLKDVAELPSMEEFEKMAAIELEDVETEGAPTDAGAADAAQPEFEESASEEEAGEGAIEAAAEPQEAQPHSNPSDSAAKSAE